jgi:hypothetical protein
MHAGDTLWGIFDPFAKGRDHSQRSPGQETFTGMLGDAQAVDQLFRMRKMYSNDALHYPLGFFKAI